MRISDWSSDVCSSDLRKAALSAALTIHQPTRAIGADAGIDIGHPAFENSIRIDRHRRERRDGVGADARHRVRLGTLLGDVPEIGRASWRERVCQYVEI